VARLQSLGRLALVPVLVASAIAPAAAAVVESTSAPYPGTSYTVYSEGSIPARLHVVEVDLTSSEITLHATTEENRGATASGYSAQSGAQIVINGDYFSPLDFTPAGLAMGNAEVWSDSADDGFSGFVSFELTGVRTYVTISPPEEVVDAAELDEATQGVVGGRPMLVRAGVAVTTFNCTDVVAMSCERAPRTAVALSENGATLWLVVVDGWQSGSLGMTAAELAQFLDDELGAYEALMLDGGAASTLVIAAEGGLVSSPSDTVERVVANHLGVHYGQLTPGQMIGLIRERDITDETANIVGATVELDDGQVDVSAADGRYNFSSVTPRYACATASMAGYHPTTSCRQVVAGQLTWNSMALFPNSDFIDASPGAPDARPPDAAGPPPDAGPPPSDAPANLADAGNPGVNGDCVCSVPGPNRQPWPNPGMAFTVLLAGFLLRCGPRRRR